MICAVAMNQGVLSKVVTLKTECVCVAEMCKETSVTRVKRVSGPKYNKTRLNNKTIEQWGRM